MTALMSPDVDVAREALDYLIDGSRAFLDRYLQRRYNVSDPHMRADLAQTVFVKLWTARGSYQNLGEAAWRGWLQRTAANCYVDYLRSVRRLASEEEFDLDAIPSDERPIIDAVLIAVEADDLFRLADVLLLELDSDVSPRMHDRRLLAAELFYVDGEPWPNVLRLLGPPPPGEPALTRQDLNQWLAHPGVLRHLVFRAVFYDNDRLTAHLLGWPEMAPDRRAQALDALMRNGLTADANAICAAAERPLSWAAVRVLVLRFRHALLVDQIRARVDQTVSELQLSALIEQCIADFPFAGEMRQIVAKIIPDGNARTRSALFAMPGLWQRLALEYRFREDLPQRDIQERLGPAADVVGYEVTAGMLNVWLSNGRLVKRIAQKFRELHADFEGETQYV